MDTFNTIRYMGTKASLLDYIIPEIEKVTNINGVVLDLMSGSNAVSYALKRNFTVYTNDVQMYSYIISLAVIVNQTEKISSNLAKIDLYDFYYNNKKERFFDFFEKTYSNTYFSTEQCSDIDSIRYAINEVECSNERKCLYLLALMCAMCKVQSTPGHFAQFMPSSNPRIVPLQKMNLFNEFILKCDQYSDLIFNSRINRAFCSDYKILLKDETIKNVNTIYLDSPYSQEQYSRFYHILETVVRYDSPNVNFKAKYREDRFKSGFCYKKCVKKEFENILSFCKSSNKNIVISYSNRALFPIVDLVDLCSSYFKNVSQKAIDYKHSTQGKGNNDIKEYVITCC